MTDEELEKVALEATPGPWTAGANRGACWIESAQAGQTVVAWDDGITRPSDAEVADARFIAAFNPATTLALLERVRKAEARVKGLESACVAAHRALFLGGGSQESASIAEHILAKTDAKS